MFNNLSDKLHSALQTIGRKKQIDSKNISQALTQVRESLLEADVALSVVDSFIDKVQAEAIGKKVEQGLSASQTFIDLVLQELTNVLGNASADLKFTKTPAIILMAGMQGAGKTTASVKLALWLQKHKKQKAILTSTDIYRPAAMEQLNYLANSVDIPTCDVQPSWSVKKIIKHSLKQASIAFADVLIIDTAGRLHLDKELMQEIQLINKLTTPCETLFVVDSMLGQEAANIARAFHENINITGTILSKADSDARGGAALSVVSVTGKPIKFLSSGEKLVDFDVFHPDRIASQILGMGDILSLIEQAKQKTDSKKAQQTLNAIKKNKRFNYNDVLTQLEQMQSMGGLESVLTKLPQQMQKLASSSVANNFDTNSLKHMQAIIQSMTQKERLFPDSINNSRKRRIMAGSATNIQTFNKLSKMMKQMSKAAKKMNSKVAMNKMMRQLDSMSGNMPPSFK